MLGDVINFEIERFDSKRGAKGGGGGFKGFFLDFLKSILNKYHKNYYLIILFNMSGGEKGGKWFSKRKKLSFNFLSTTL